eukprot:m.140888 g.140888  ORF g.140888 m.140888 type:complete len:158 (-) comp14835_c0_seq1:4480-4953(-)
MGRKKRGWLPPPKKRPLPTSTKGESSQQQPKKKKKNSTLPYKVNQKILLVGEGNFSFSASLAHVLKDGTGITATCYDDQEVIREKYKDSEGFEDTVTGMGGFVFYGVDATKLATCPYLSAPYDTVVFNFPHCGLGIKDQQKMYLKTRNFLLPLFGPH